VFKIKGVGSIKAKLVGLIGLLLVLLLLFSACNGRIYVSPPGFMELMESFDEISATGRSFSYTNWFGVEIDLEFVGNIEDLSNIPAIRDAIGEYLRSDIFNEFLDTETSGGLLRDNRDRDHVTLKFWQESNGRHRIVEFFSRTNSNFHNWEALSEPTTNSRLNDFFEKHYTTILNMRWQMEFVKNGVAITISPCVDRAYHQQSINPNVLSEELLHLFDETKPNLHDFVNGELNAFLENLNWLDIRSGFTVTFQADLSDVPCGHFWVTDYTILDTVAFKRFGEGSWVYLEEYESLWEIIAY